MKDYYKILELEYKESISGINKKRVNLIKNFRENRGQKDFDTNKFILQLEACYVLKNAKRKSLYDRLYLTHFGNRISNKLETNSSGSGNIEIASTDSFGI